MPKTLLMGSFKKRKGLRQGGKEGLKTSARNPLPANTPRSDKSSHHLLSRKIFSLNLQTLSVNGVFRAIFFAITVAKAFKISLKRFVVRYRTFPHRITGS